MIAVLLLVALEHLPLTVPLVGEVVLERTSFVEVQRMFGAAPIQNNGRDAGRFAKFVCYRSADRSMLLLWAGPITANSLEVSGFALRVMRTNDYYERTILLKDGQAATVRGVEVSLKKGVVDALSAEQATTD